MSSTLTCATRIFADATLTRGWQGVVLIDVKFVVAVRALSIASTSNHVFSCSSFADILSEESFLRSCSITASTVELVTSTVMARISAGITVFRVDLVIPKSTALHALGGR